jgi:diguanylate cyclase (GGDEF)-like protein
MTLKNTAPIADCLQRDVGSAHEGGVTMSARGERKPRAKVGETVGGQARRAQRTRRERGADEEVARLGRALGARADDVLARAAALLAARDHGSIPALAPAMEESFDHVGSSSTTALARWMAGEHAGARGEEREAWQTFGQLAAQNAAPLNELTKRCLHWRDAVLEVLTESVEELGLSSRALAQAVGMTQRALDAGLVRVGDAFELERERIAQELARREEELTFLATHDQLTGLPNRTLLLDRGEQMLGRARRRGDAVAALVMDLDNFAAVNDALGLEVGDELLRAIAARLQSVVRDADALARIGGDRFVVLAEEISDDTHVELITERMRAAVDGQFALASDAHGSLTVTASIGVATGERTSVEELLRDADIATQRAKLDGKNRDVVFEPGMQAVAQGRLELEMDLREALERDEFFLVYQPMFDLTDMRPTAVEALIRWKNGARGVVQPDAFIPLLEDTGLIVDVGRWVLCEACREAAAWRRGEHEIGVTVNVSARQLESDRIVGDVRDAIATSGIDACALTLEITETALTRNPEQTARRLLAIKALGVRIAIDDFGTGYSSFAQLRRFPVDVLKIDRSFVSRVSENPEGETLLRTLVQLGKALSIDTVAEGIEHEDELSLLLDERCPGGQGYLFSQPLEVSAAAKFLRKWRVRSKQSQLVARPRDEAPSGATQVRPSHGGRLTRPGVI